MHDIDAALISQLGGPAAVAQALELGDDGAARVARWMKAGIPYRYRLEYLSLWRRAAFAIMRDAQGKRFARAIDKLATESED